MQMRFQYKKGYIYRTGENIGKVDISMERGNTKVHFYIIVSTVICK